MFAEIFYFCLFSCATKDMTLRLHKIYVGEEKSILFFLCRLISLSIREKTPLINKSKENSFSRINLKLIKSN